MKIKIAEIQIVPIKPVNGLVAFASFVLDEKLYMGSIGIITRPNGGYRLTYPTKTIGTRDMNIYYPINKEFAIAIEKEVTKRLEEVMKIKNDRYSSTNNE